MFGFGIMGTLDPQVAMISIYVTIFFILLFEFVTGLLEYCISDSPLYNKMVQHIYKELMQMGVVSFLVVLYESSSSSVNTKWIVSIDFAHILLFFFCIFFVIHAFFLMFVSFRTSQEYLKMDLRTNFSCVESLGNHSFWQNLLFYFPVLQLSQNRATVEYKIIHSLFQDAYCKIPLNFHFPLYLSKCFERYALKTIEVSPISWLVVFFLVLGNFFRQKFDGPLSCPVIVADENAHRLLGSVIHDNTTAVVEHAVDGCYASFMKLFFFSAFILCSYLIILLVFARVYKHRLIERAGVGGPSEYSGFMLFLAREEMVVGKAKAGVKATATDCVNDNYSDRYSVLELKEFIQECLDAMEFDEESKFYREVTDALRNFYNFLNESVYDAIAAVRLRINGGVEQIADDSKIFSSNNKVEVEESSSNTQSEGPGGGLLRTPSKMFSRRSVVRKSTVTIRPAPFPENNSSKPVQAFSKPDNSQVHISDSVTSLDDHGDRSEQASKPPSIFQQCPELDSVVQVNAAEINRKLRSFSYDSSSEEKSDDDHPIKASKSGPPVATVTPSNASSSVKHSFTRDKQMHTLRGGKNHSESPSGSLRPRSVSGEEAKFGTLASSSKDAALGSPAATSLRGPETTHVEPIRQISEISRNSDRSSNSHIAAAVTGPHSSDAFAGNPELVINHNAASKGRRKSVMGSGTVAMIRDINASDNESMPLETHGLSLLEKYNHFRNSQAPGKSKSKVSPENLEAQPGVDDQDREDFSDVFLFGSPIHFYRCVEVAIMLNCLYMSFWSTNYIKLVNDFSPNVILWQLLMLVPIAVSFMCIGEIARVCSLLKAVTACDSNLDIILEVILDMEDRELLTVQLKERMLAKIEGREGDMHQIIQKIFDEIDEDRSGFIDKIEFRSLLRRLELTYSDSRFKKLFTALDRNCAGVLCCDDLMYLLFPQDSHVSKR